MSNEVQVHSTASASYLTCGDHYTNYSVVINVPKRRSYTNNNWKEELSCDIMTVL